MLLAGSPAIAQDVAIPNFWDPRARPERPDTTALPRSLKVLTDDEYPPLHFAGPDGTPTGFSVELVRAACERIGVACTVQARRFDTLLDALAAKDGDIVAAAVPLSASLRARFAATGPYFRLPARFAVRAGRTLPAPDPTALAGRPVGVIGGTAHEAYLRAFFGRAEIRSYPDLATAQVALRADEVEYLFADGLSLALWIGGTTSENCCAYRGGPYLESRFFGEGIGLVVRKDDALLRRALDEALQHLSEDGHYAELYLRFFPVSPF